MNTTLKHFSLCAMLAAALALAGCGGRQPAAGSHDQGNQGNAAHDGHAPAGEKITDYGDRTELFVEFPSLVVGQQAIFVAHFTWLTDFKPLTEGKLTVVISGGTAPEERFVADAPVVPGIFKPGVTPRAAGDRELTFIVETAQGSITHKLGRVHVYAGAKEAAAQGGKHAGEGIPFTKEQQWKVDFATTEATKGTVRPSVAATATVRARPDGEARLVAPVAGVLRAAGSFPGIGQHVTKGQVLAMLSPRLGGDADQATLDASASKARIMLEQARRERERMEALFMDEAIPEKRLLEARANERMAEAEAMAAQARQEQLGGAGGISIRAPIDGVIADVAIAPGSFVAEGTALFHIANTGRLWLEARVPESEIGRLGTPSGASFEVGGFAHPFIIEPGKNGKLIAVGGAVDPATRTVPAIFEFDNPESGLRLGMAAKAWLYGTTAQEAVLVPASAVQDESGLQTVYMQTGGESFERRIVRTGARDGERIAIVEGLEPGLRVVSRGAYLIRLSTSKAGPSGHAH